MNTPDPATSDSARNLSGPRDGASPTPLWTPSESRVEAANLTSFVRAVNERTGRSFDTYADLHAWSIECPEEFWPAIWDFGGVISRTRGERVIAHPDRMPDAGFFPDARLNFAENLLRESETEAAIVFRREDGDVRRVSRSELRSTVARLARGLRAAGVRPGDRVAGTMPNIPETVAAMLAAASVGAVWSSCSPDFGLDGVRDRFGQIEPVVLFVADGAFYKGKRADALETARQFAAGAPSLRKLVIVPFTTEEVDPDPGATPSECTWDEFLGPDDGPELTFEALPFDHPLYVLYSSGTTGKPKCIVHGAGGTLLEHMKELMLHTDVKPGSRFFYHTTCGWMMWNWLVSGLAVGATIYLYDGFPFHPHEGALFDYAAEESIEIFGTSAKYLAAAEKAGLRPGKTHDLSSLRAVLSTGSPLSHESFDYVYREISEDVHLASISGGTDIVGLFAGGNPTAPVYRGEIQCLPLGKDVRVFDDEGRPVVGQKGELVCTRPFPAMPVGFFNDPDGSRYHAAYFDVYPGIWRHGDWVELTERGGMVIYGRSDAVLNPGGVRIGTAEIYREVEKLDEILEAIAVGQDFEGDERIVLFVRLRPGVELDEGLIGRIRGQIREGASPRHVPARVAAVDDIPRTKSGKIVELAVKNVIHGRPVKNTEALANPEALEQFRDRAELRS